MPNNRVRTLGGGALLLALAIAACSPVSDAGKPASGEPPREAVSPPRVTLPPALVHPADDPADEPVQVTWPSELIAPVGRVFTVSGEDRSARLHVSLDGEVREIASLPGNFRPVATLAPDRAHVAVIPDYSNNHGTKLLLLTVDGNVKSEKVGMFMSVAWHPGSKTVAAVRLHQERPQDPPLAVLVQYALDGTETAVTEEYPYLQRVLGYNASGDALYVTYLSGPIETTPGPGLNLGVIDVATGQLTELLASDWPDGNRYLADVHLRKNDDGHVVITITDHPPKRTKSRLGIMVSDTDDVSWLDLPEMPDPWTVTSSYIWGDDGRIAWSQRDQVWVMETGSAPVHVATIPNSWWEWELDSLTADGGLWMYDRRVGYIRLDASMPGQVLPEAPGD